MSCPKTISIRTGRHFKGSFTISTASPWQLLTATTSPLQIYHHYILPPPELHYLPISVITIIHLYHKHITITTPSIREIITTNHLTSITKAIFQHNLPLSPQHYHFYNPTTTKILSPPQQSHHHHSCTVPSDYAFCSKSIPGWGPRGRFLKQLIFGAYLKMCKILSKDFFGERVGGSPEAS